MNFLSDNGFGVHDDIFDAMRAVNAGPVASYGEDELSKSVTEKFGQFFETPVEVLFVPTGTAANALSLSAYTPPWGVAFVHQESHIAIEECGATEFYTSGAKVEPLTGFGAKLTPQCLSDALANFHVGMAHMAQPATISLTQATECGTVYSLDEIKALCAIAKANDLRAHMDGARFANALVHLRCSPADMTWRAGIDVLSFGATKGGAMAAEAVILFNPGKAQELAFRRKRGGHLLSKQRFIAAQFNAYLQNDLWRTLATHANDLAHRLSLGLSEISGVRLAWPTQANEVFPILPEALNQHLARAGARYHPWTTRGLTGTDQAPAPDEILVRLVTSFATTKVDVDGFLELARGKN
ncbi:MAG: threonine aldolase family protein [Alphaproteobacteria bacterium]